MSTPSFEEDVFRALSEIGVSETTINTLKSSESTVDDTVAAELANTIIRLESEGKNSLIDVLKTCVESNDINDEFLVHLLMVCVATGKADKRAFELLEKAGVLSKIVELHRSSDVLLQMTAAELIDALSNFEDGLNFLVSQKEFEAIAARLHQEQDPLQVHSRLRSLTQAIHKHPQLLPSLLELEDKVVLEKIKNCFRDSEVDVSAILCALSCIDDLGRSEEGRRALISYLGEELMEELTEKMRHRSHVHISCAATHTWIGWLHDGIVLKAEKGTDRTIRTFVEKRLVRELAENLVNRPFPELRPFVYRLAACLCAFKENKACCMMLLSNDACRAILLDYKSDPEHETRYAKNELQKVIIKNHDDWIATVLGKSDAERLRSFAKNNPYWIPPDFVPVVAMSSRE